MIITHLILQWLQYFWAWVAQIWIAKDIWSLSSYTQCIFNATKIYHINYGVIQGFPALRKAATTHMKKYDFFTCLISAISCWHVNCLLHHLVRLMNEWKSLYHSQSMVICQNFFWLWLPKQWKIDIVQRHWPSNFPRRGRKPNYKKKNWKLCIPWLW